MRVIIAGSRTIESGDVVADAVYSSGWSNRIVEVVSGGAAGVDRLGERYARAFDVRLSVFPAKWVLYGKSAGPRRNREMAEYADALIAVWDGESRGTKNMIEEMERLGKPVYVWKVKS